MFHCMKKVCKSRFYSWTFSAAVWNGRTDDADRVDAVSGQSDFNVCGGLRGRDSAGIYHGCIDGNTVQSPLLGLFP